MREEEDFSKKRKNSLRKGAFIINGMGKRKKVFLSIPRGVSKEALEDFLSSLFSKRVFLPYYYWEVVLPQKRGFSSFWITLEVKEHSSLGHRKARKDKNKKGKEEREIFLLG